MEFLFVLLPRKHNPVVILHLGVVFCLLCPLLSVHEAREQKGFVFLPMHCSSFFQSHYSTSAFLAPVCGLSTGVI